MHPITLLSKYQHSQQTAPFWNPFYLIGFFVMYLAAGMVLYGKTWVFGNHGRQWMRTDYMGNEEGFCCCFYLITFLISLQVRILLRAMNMLKHDGRIVYSTCSLNPVENEAVIAEALRINPGMGNHSENHLRFIRLTIYSRIWISRRFFKASTTQATTWCNNLASNG